MLGGNGLVEIGNWKFLMRSESTMGGGAVKTYCFAQHRVAPIHSSPKMLYLATDTFHISYLYEGLGVGDLWLRPR